MKSSFHTEPGTNKAGGRRLPRLASRMTWRSGAVLLVVVLLLAFSAQRAVAWQSERSRASDGKAAPAAATAEVEGLVDVSGSTSKADMAQLPA